MVRYATTTPRAYSSHLTPSSPTLNKLLGLCSMLMMRDCFTATLRQRICYWGGATRSCSVTLALPSWPKAYAPNRHKIQLVLSPTWHPSNSMGILALLAISTPWVSLSMHGQRARAPFRGHLRTQEGSRCTRLH